MPHCTPVTCNTENPCIHTIHAEANAVAFAARYGIATKGATMYCTASPCLDCAKLIINAGIVHVIYDEEYRVTTPIQFLLDAGVDIHRFGRASRYDV